MDNYYTKYLKYKNKYLKLKGGSLEEIQKLIAEGKTLEQIIEAGHTHIEQIIAAGYTDIEQLITVGCTAMDFKKANVPLRFLVSIKMPDKSYRNYFNLRELLEGGYTQQDFKDSYIMAYYFEDNPSPLDIRRAGLDKEIRLSELNRYDSKIKPTLPSLQELMIRQEENIKKIKEEEKKGTSLKDLAHKYKISELMIAGFDKRDLLLERLPASKLVGFISLHDLMVARYSPKELKEAGVSLRELKDAGFSASELVMNRFGARELREAGFTLKELTEVGFGVIPLRRAGFTLTELKEVGFGAYELRGEGFSAKELKEVGFDPRELRIAGFSAKELKDLGYTAQNLKDAEFSANELKKADFSFNDLLIVGYDKDIVDIIKLKDEGFSATQLKKRYTFNKLKDAEVFSHKELKEAGFTLVDFLTLPEQKNKRIISVEKLAILLDAGFSIEDFKGVSADNLKQAESLNKIYKGL